MTERMNKPAAHRRAHFHDYKAPAIYHITLKKRPGVPDFGVLAGDYRVPCGETGSVYVQLTPLGQVIKAEILAFPTYHPEIQLYQYVIMPDHVHILLRVKTMMTKPLGTHIGGMTGGIRRAWRCVSDLDYPVFVPGFNDRIIGKNRSLEVLFRYIRENPWRLAVRRALPEYFRRVRRVVIEDREYEAYGNMQLLDNPFKEPVVVHRADTEETRCANRSRWLHAAANGGVLVSPFISPAEKEVRAAAEEVGGKVILIRHEEFAERNKPDAHDFGLCLSGRLLIVSCGAPPRPDLDRAACLQMNVLAAVVASYPQ